MTRALFTAVVFSVFSCAHAGPPLELAGHRYDATLETKGCPLAFELTFEQKDQEPLRAFVHNGIETVEIPVVKVVDEEITLEFDHYDSTITAKVLGLGARLKGMWSKRVKEFEYTGVNFVAVRSTGVERRFDAAHAERFAGRWSVRFTQEEYPAVGIFSVGADGRLLGTFLTTTGDYRYLVGSATATDMTLSCFDGSHAFTFLASLQPGGSLRGDFFSGASFHDRWTAVRDESADLPDPFALTRYTGSARALSSLSYPDASGTTVSLGECAGKPRIIELFGTWCPNCHDATKLLVELHGRYKARGLEVIGLAFEVSGNGERDRHQVKLYTERHGVQFPVLIAGRRDKSEATEAFPIIDRVRAYPTFLFVDADDQVRGVYTGFSGPATGEAAERLRSAFIERIESMLPPR